MRAFLLGVGCAIIGAASGFAGGYAYSEMQDNSASTTTCHQEDTGRVDATTGRPTHETVCVKR